MSVLRIGTCSWKYPSWKGIVYSDARDINYLREYATRYDTVEIDQWFWSLHGPDKVALPHADTVREYMDAVPEDFLFTIKVPNSLTLTHFHRKKKSDPLTENPHFLSEKLFFRFLEILAPMEDRIASLMLQFEYLNKSKMPTQSDFLDKLGNFLSGCPENLPIGIESRNPNYLNPAYFGLLRKYAAHHVFLQGYYMPPIWEVAERTGAWPDGSTVLRLHGPDRKGIEERSGGKWDRIVEARDEELQHITAFVREMLSRDVDVLLNVNNHYEGSAPLTITKIRELLG